MRRVEAPARPRVLVTLDCDGTLLDPQGEITVRVRAAVRAAVEAGALVTLATGRRLEGARRYAEALGVRTPLVLLDGAAVQDPFSGELFHTDPVPAPLVRSVVGLAMEYGLHPVAYRITPDPHGDTIHVLEGADADPIMARYLASRSPVVREDATALLAAEPIGRVSAMGEEEPARRLYAHVVERAEELCCRVLFSPPVTYAQYPFSAVLVSNGGCTKARAIEVVAAQHGLTLAQCVAVGDAENDVEILREVAAAGGISAAMAQAPEVVKAAARYVVPSNAEDGVAVAIEEYVLPALQRAGAV